MDSDLFLIVPTLLFLLLPALVITRVARGASALRDLLGSMVRFRVGVGWYLLPLLAVPALTCANGGGAVKRPRREPRRGLFTAPFPITRGWACQSARFPASGRNRTSPASRPPGSTP